jgi:hypothetical protein
MEGSDCRLLKVTFRHFIDLVEETHNNTLCIQLMFRKYILPQSSRAKNKIISPATKPK